MKNKKLLVCYVLILVLSCFTFSKVCATSINDNAINIVVNAYNLKSLPDHFRKTTDKINTENSKAINLEGLDKLNISGSKQFSENGLLAIKENLGNKFHITDVDLRQESHGFANGIAISWENKENNANVGMSTEQILADENEKLKNILNKNIALSHNGTNITKVENVSTEQKLVTDNGMSYVRIPVTDKKKPSNEAVDYFVNFVKTLPNDTWLHFHCKAGEGRTTTFMAMYDMMKNSKNVKLEDIIQRQALIGGEDLFKNNKISNNKNGRVEFLKNFYKYCSENNDNFKTTWSQWLKNNNLASNNNSLEYNSLKFSA